MLAGLSFPMNLNGIDNVRARDFLVVIRRIAGEPSVPIGIIRGMARVHMV